MYTLYTILICVGAISVMLLFIVTTILIADVIVNNSKQTKFKLQIACFRYKTLNYIYRAKMYKNMLFIVVSNRGDFNDIELANILVPKQSYSKNVLKVLSIKDVLKREIDDFEDCFLR